MKTTWGVTDNNSAPANNRRNSRVNDVVSVNIHRNKNQEQNTETYNSQPLSSSGMSAGADDPTVGILDLSDPPGYNIGRDEA